MHFNSKSVTLLLLAAQVALIAIILLVRAGRLQSRSSLLLGCLLVLAVLYIFPFLAGFAGWYAEPQTRSILFYFPFQQVLIIPPVAWLYFQSLLQEDFSIDRKKYVHFIPGALYIVFALVMAMWDLSGYTTFRFYGDGRDRDFDPWYQYAGFFSLGIYTFFSLRDYQQYADNVRDKVSYADEVLFRWIRNFLVAVSLLLLLRLVFFVTNPEWGNFGDKFWYYVVFGVIMVYLGLHGFAHAVRTDGTLRTRPVEREITTESLPGEEQEKELILNAVVSNEMYRNARLTVADVAEAVGIPAKRISQIINSSFQMNFNDFVNFHRVHEVRYQIDQGGLKTRTLLALAEYAGFNSKTTFNRAFKRWMEITPKEYAAISAEIGAKSGFGATRADQ